MSKAQAIPPSKVKKRPSSTVPTEVAHRAEPEPKRLSPGGDLHDVYRRIRQDILNGNLAPGDILNQVHIAKRYGVSRTPVREALRMLQAENLVDAHFQHRTRVTNVTSEEVDSVYATWILMQSLGIALTVPFVTDADLSALRQAFEQMTNHSPLNGGTQDEWEQLHVDFHRLLFMHAGPIIKDSIENCWLRSERARRLHMRSAPQSWLASEEEHRDVVVAFEEGSVEQAIHAASRQLARNSLAVIASIDPSYEPRAIRQALKLTLQRSSATADAPGAPAGSGAVPPSANTPRKRSRPVR
ncbi:GntR family transcriptional regulator [Burkholderia stagnalis]